MRNKNRTNTLPLLTTFSQVELHSVPICRTVSNLLREASPVTLRRTVSCGAMPWNWLCPSGQPQPALTQFAPTASYYVHLSTHIQHLNIFCVNSTFIRPARNMLKSSRRICLLSQYEFKSISSTKNQFSIVNPQTLWCNFYWYPAFHWYLCVQEKPKVTNQKAKCHMDDWSHTGK